MSGLDDVFDDIKKRQKKLLFIKLTVLVIWYIASMVGLWFI